MESENSRGAQHILSRMIRTILIIIIVTVLFGAPIVRNWWNHYGSVTGDKLIFNVPSDAETVDPTLLINYVDVRRINLNIDSPSRQFIDRTLPMFFNTPHPKIFNGVSSENWVSKWSDYKTALLHEAGFKKFDLVSLRRCIDYIEKENTMGLPLLPVAAYLANNGKNDIWIIVAMWGWPSEDFGHVRVWAFKVDSGKLLGFATCM
ncbi:MAG: hypothetical protein HZA15_03640 [Nitrospirae bacterium]|nr:hypothetical protein [Nitrospirota bacterium]